MERFKLSERQAQAILDMQLRRLAALERQKIEDEHRQTLERIAYLEDLLASPKKILDVIKEDLSDLVEKYGDERRTHIVLEEMEEIREEDLIPDEAALISITQRGYVKRVAAKAFRAQARGGRGVTGHTTKDEDAVLMLFPARTLDTVLFFSDKGKVYAEKAYQIPDADRTGRGIPIVNVLALSPGESITAAVAVPEFAPDAYATMATAGGKIKRMALSEIASVRTSGLMAITLENGDQLGWVRLTNGSDDIILVTEQGQALRFSEKVVRPMGRQAGGVTAIRLSKDDRVASMEVVEPNGCLMLVTTRGYGKRVSLEEYPVKGRATGGVVTINQKSLGVTGKIAAARVVQVADDLTIITRWGVVLRSRVKDFRKTGRATRGDHQIKLQKGDEVASMARIADADLRSVGVTASTNGDSSLGNGSDGTGDSSRSSLEGELSSNGSNPKE
jgi:DNA gyrase subunit A